ncbi:unnamed protein product [Rangifer tarandus platyrhynchus]|uniref:Uncharacterized protein n=2 Tax=Rangifer tarandus platyrhynchus TaxID=3082113 RepID=A0ABN8Z5K1_RANTA|nr:unnamed protein product [Rangifer tarandus platyrhynchus]CAI9704020.1 unnamed protein product [Rangifer tarandus platyrhynchus]
MERVSALLPSDGSPRTRQNRGRGTLVPGLLAPHARTIHFETRPPFLLMLKKEEEEGRGEGGGLQWGWEALHEPVAERGSGRRCGPQPAQEAHELPCASTSLAAWSPA